MLCFDPENDSEQTLDEFKQERDEEFWSEAFGEFIAAGGKVIAIASPQLECPPNYGQRCIFLI